MAEKHNIFLKRTFVAITGASRGLGRSIALQFGAKFPASSVLVLMDIISLDHVKSELTSVAPDIKVLVRSYDQGSVENIDYFKNIFKELLLENRISKDHFEQYMIVHNCASPGDVTEYALELSDSKSVRKYYDINLTGMILLNTSFFQTFSDSTKSRVVVNMSSALASNPVASMHLYCTGKVARDMFMRVLAVEEPSLRILTFAPGSVDTEMAREVERLTVNKSFSEKTEEFRATGKMKHPDIPISKLC